MLFTFFNSRRNRQFLSSTVGKIYTLEFNFHKKIRLFLYSPTQNFVLFSIRPRLYSPLQGIHRWRLDGAICEYLVEYYIALGEWKTKQNFVLSNRGKGKFSYEN